MNRIGLCIWAIWIAAASRAVAQTPAATVVRFHIVDEQNNPVAGALIDVDDRTGALQRSLQTDANGRQSAVLPRAGTYDYEVRKIGFEAQVGNFPVGAGKSIDVSVTLVRSTVQLDTVRTEARTRATDYTLTAADIARSDRKDPDAYDILFHLKPKMLGEPMRYCPYAQNLWVNGRRVILPPWEHVIPLQPVDRPHASSDGERYARYRPPPIPMSHAPPDSPLTHIRPQDISEIRFVDCWTQSTIPGRYGNNALFVTLKSGVAFDVKKGSYIADSASARNAGVIP